MPTTNEASLQSTTSAVVGSSGHVMEPVARMIEKTWPARRTLSIIVYRRADREDVLADLVAGIIRELGVERAVRFRVRSWIFWWFFPLCKGASRPPILEIDGKVYSQGMVPEKEQLKRYIHSLLV
ncbi:MAG: hypothetical protein Q7S09_04575 [bacterium]|nr:hypothetical protein [bacterium]